MSKESEEVRDLVNAFNGNKPSAVLKTASAIARQNASVQVVTDAADARVKSAEATRTVSEIGSTLVSKSSQRRLEAINIEAHGTWEKVLATLAQNTVRMSATSS